MPKRAATRRPPEERRQEIIDTALALADTLGLDRITSRDVATTLGVTSGLIHHYFPTVDDLVVAAFAQTASAQNDQDRQACQSLPPTDALRALIQRSLSMGSANARIWMSAWVAAPRRPDLAREVDKQMIDGLDVLTDLLRRGHDAGVFRVSDPAASALRILVLVDGVLVQVSMRSETTYGDVHALVWDTVEREVGLPLGSLRPENT
ncbi:TetR/AcrR family transcriptional regulator [Microtetraspora fusca]|uniref:TetR/AcrR family transcriptional regulator n=1 Tax=Microtetraspora fusca TaxID=1997 RepID=UPI00083294E5|nr:TetR/AcrR family transcriptional regulator [Microtetraspora fusca]